VYIYKKKNKFPHIICIDVPGDDPILIECNLWLKQNLGAYKKSWFCPSWETVTDDFYDDLWPYAFKSIEDAMAFKLRWM